LLLLLLLTRFCSSLAASQNPTAVDSLYKACLLKLLLLLLLLQITPGD
jgi:hypothetical protein